MNEQETSADIIAKMHDYSNECNDGYHTDYGVVCADMRHFADRFKAALMRERGDCAKLRGAVKCLMDNLNIHLVQPSQRITLNRAELDGMLMVCEEALKEGSAK